MTSHILDEGAVDELLVRAIKDHDEGADLAACHIPALCATVNSLRAQLKLSEDWRGTALRERDETERLLDAVRKRADTNYAALSDLQSQLEQLRAERDELRNALLPFALLDIRHLQDRSDHEPIWAINKSQITNGHIRKAQQLMQQAVDLDKSRYQGEM